MTPPDPGAAPLVQLRAAGCAVVLDVGGPLPPRVLHWGADPGALDADELGALACAAVPAVPASALDDPWELTLVPGEAEGWQGRPGLSAHRGGLACVPRWRTTSVDVDGGNQRTDANGGTVRVSADDAEHAITWEAELRLEPSGLLRIRHRVTSTAEPGGEPLTVADLPVLLPVPADAVELLDLTGRHTRERVPQRQPFHLGTRLRESRRGRTGHDATLVLAAGTAGFGFRSGEVWGVHVAWSGDHVHLAERLPERAAQGAGVLGGGELLRAGEVRLAAGESYETPWVCFTWSGEGLDGAASRVHRWLRSRPHHPRRPRPVVLNTWEAVYFDHDLERLTALADVAARVGVERFVLDDGWFPGRRHDRAGLGDWEVDPQVWPRGLHPLVDHVRSLGMEFGLWVEPEMVNADSALARAHPQWVLSAPGRSPRKWRWQQVLDLSRAEVFEHLLGRLDAVVAEYRPAYLKWDQNRDVLEAVCADGAAGVHRQTVALYALLDALRRRHPDIEIESCASGGGRVDLGILERTDRVWASDTNDALERQRIQRWTGQLLPPELVGSHVGPPVAHTTGRHGDLELRCATALFGSAGMEWDLTTASPEDLDVLTRWTAMYRELRPLLHGGDVVRADHPDPTAWLHGCVAPDRSRALFCYVRMDTAVEAHPGRVRLPGLDPRRRYRVRHRGDLGGRVGGMAPPAWMRRTPPVLSGSVLAGAGLAMPVTDPGTAVLLHLEATAGAQDDAGGG